MRRLLNYCNDPQYRRRILGQLSRGESRDGLARQICHGRNAELRQPYRQGQEEQLGALGLVVNAIVLYNTIHTQRALEQLNATGHGTPDEDIRRLSPLATEHINLAGRYHLALPEPIQRGEYWPLKLGDQSDAASA